MKKATKKEEEDFKIIVKYNPSIDKPSPPNTISCKWVYVDFSYGK